MRGHTQSAELQAQACTIFYILTLGNTENTTEAGNAGAIEAIVVAMRRHTQHDELQVWACEVFFKLIVSNAKNRIKAAKAGAIEAIAAAMRSRRLGGEKCLEQA